MSDNQEVRPNDQDSGDSSWVAKAEAAAADGYLSPEESETALSRLRERDRRYSLETFVAGITQDNLHGEIDLGGPVGREQW